MKIKLISQDDRGLCAALSLLLSDLGITLTEEAADLTVTAERGEKTTEVTLTDTSAKIKYANGRAGFFRALAMLLDRMRRGEGETSFSETPIFERVGTMVDMSRNGAMSVEGVELMLRKCALMGMNTYMLYTEDNYEIDGYPYFGHMRGRYSKEDLRKLDAYAGALGIELIPCIQMSGHLATHLIWGAASKYKDTASTLLSGAEETYELIHAMMRSISECFTTRRIHIGMDEARDLGSGKYLEINGYRPRSEIFLDHLARVREIVKSYGFRPMMWSDMFFRLAAGGKIPGYRDYDLRVELTEEISEKVPRDVTQVFWDYYHEDEEFYASNIDKHRQYISENVIFAGGVYLWCGPCPLYRLTLKNSLPALRASRDKGVSEVLATVWLSGSEGTHILSLPGLALYADFAYRGEYREEWVAECFRMATGEDYSAIMALEAPEHPDGGIYSLARALLYNDPLMGNADANLEMLPLADYYKDCTELLHRTEIKSPVFRSAHKLITALSELLMHKADFGIRLRRAYDAHDTAALRKMRSECDRVIEKLELLRTCHRAVWSEYCKAAGWEVHDIRYGGLIARFETVKHRLCEYLSGKCEKIEELEIPRLAIDSKPENIGKFTDVYTAIKYNTYATVNIL